MGINGTKKQKNIGNNWDSVNTSYDLMLDILKSDEVEGEKITPQGVAKDMVQLLPPVSDKTFWNPNTTFIDIFCKSGVFLQIILNNLMEALKDFDGFQDEAVRREHIINNQLYACVPGDGLTAMLVSRSLVGEIFSGNITSYDIRESQKSSGTYKGLLAQVKERLGQEFNRMNFNVVIGNPPYNRGGDIDFVNLGFDIQTEYTVMITPAKWQTAEADQKIASKMSYGGFRRKLVPHMREVVFYPDCADIFRIKILDGIQYYFIDKLNTYESCRVINRCKNQKLFNNEQYRPILDGQILNNCGNDVIEHLKSSGYKQLKCQAIVKDRQFVVYQNNVLQCARSIPNEYQAYGMLQYKEGKNLVLGATDIIDTSKEMYELELSGVQTAIFSQDNRKECESFVQYINTKLCKFLIFVNISKMQPYNDNTFKFVPYPMILDNSGNRVRGEFDHIYTDDELYKTWNIPQKYIEVIEAVVKERDNNNYKAMVEKCYYLYNFGITFKDVLNTNYDVKERNSVGIGIFIKKQLDTIFSKSTKVYQLENLQNFLLNNQGLMDSTQKVRINFYSSEAMQDGVKPQNILKILIKLYPKAFNGEWYRECLEMIKYWIPDQNSLDSYNKQNEYIEKLLYICETLASLSVIVGSLCPQDERLSSIKMDKNCEFEIDGRNIIIETIQE